MLRLKRTWLYFLQPPVLMKICDTIIPWSFGIFVIFLSVGLINGLINSPADYQQKELVRIMYVHVPASWGALLCYSLMAGLSLLAFIFQMNIFHLMTHAVAPIGGIFCIISL